jgi:hypothetical protein
MIMVDIVYTSYQVPPYQVEMTYEPGTPHPLICFSCISQDLRLENIPLWEVPTPSEKGGRVVAKLTDFGLHMVGCSAMCRFLHDCVEGCVVVKCLGFTHLNYLNGVPTV